ncbi:unnamed protein product [Darwinula stevensoni]|uniref:WSC domain-containing protein n=1 Tax=Darwinula stevensoni TaxID=69355 RepID=A0A7R9FS03_9CRUS|nr:unnamed protein product [Darwinula stevensoni]CAG0902761.1 unnamed protein product [Darwinula stevensoni]
MHSAFFHIGLSLRCIPSLVFNSLKPRSSTGVIRKISVGSIWMASESPSEGASVHKWTNRLAHEKSPYLLQHAHNPVDWYPWGEEAFKKARDERKLIFLSVGYSTCHWCHVMEHESFENEDIAKIMNEHYVNIKVDREERPDVDKVYMTFIQATVGGGGWPMSVWLTPSLKPIYGGTYFPPIDRYFGQPGFTSILQSLAEKWNEQKDNFEKSGEKLIQALSSGTALKGKAKTVPGEAGLMKCMEQFSRRYDPVHGGFGSEPKFPQPSNFNFLFAYADMYQGSGEEQHAIEMSLHSLRCMAKGGIHDHVAKGFARYSTDEEWHVPHFEKMLYDQGQLTVSYVDAYLASKDEFFANVARDILEYVQRDLSDPSGGFYSAEDADSYPTEGSPKKREGAFCVWTWEEIQTLLEEKKIPNHEEISLADIICHHFDVKKDGNVNPYKDPHDELKRQNVLIIRGSEEKTAEHFKIDVSTLKKALEDGRKILFEARRQRPRPHLDDKMITGWIGLMVSGFVRAGQALDDESYIERGLKALKFLKKHLYNPETETLLHSCYRGSEKDVVQIQQPIEGFLDDYTFVVRAALDAYQACYDPQWLEWADLLQKKQDELFWDEKESGYFSTTALDPSILLRLKDDQDGAEPSANSVSVRNLLRLSSSFDRPDYLMKAREILKLFSERLLKVPMALPEMAAGLAMYIQSPTQILIVGKPEQEDTREMLRAVNLQLLPNSVILIADGNVDSFLYKNASTLQNMKLKENECIGKPSVGISGTWVMRNHERASQKETGNKEKTREDGWQWGKILTWWMLLAGIILYFSYILCVISDNKEIPKDVIHNNHLLPIPKSLKLVLEPHCDKTTQRALDAVHKATSAACQRQILNITCQFLKGDLFPFNFQSKCHTNDEYNAEGIKGQYMGCFQDGKSRILSGTKGNLGQGNSPSACITYCLQAGFPYAGVEYSKECWCGRSQPDEGKQVAEDACNMLCPTGTDKCGGYFTVNIYKTGISYLQYEKPQKPDVYGDETGAGKVKIAFLLTWSGRGLRQVKRLLSALYRPHHYYFIHVDERAEYLHRGLKAMLVANPLENVVLTDDRVRTMWCGSNLLEAHLRSLGNLPSNWSWDFVINLSETDFPIRPLEDLEEFLFLNRGKNFLRSHGQEAHMFFKKQALDWLFHQCDDHMWRLAQRPLPQGIVLDGGSDWFVLNHHFVCYLLERMHDPMVKGLIEFFTYALLPSEMFFHVVLRNSPLCETRLDQHLRLVNWDRKKGCRCQYKSEVDWCGCSPNALRLHHLQKILSARARPAFFARKFIPSISATVLNKVALDLHPLEEEPLSWNSYWENLYHYEDSNQSLCMEKAVNAWETLLLPGLPFQFHHSTILEAWLHFQLDRFKGIVVQLEGSLDERGRQPQIIEAFIERIDPIITRNLESSLAKKILNVAVEANWDLKEERSLSYHGFICPESKHVSAYGQRTGRAKNLLSR